MAVAAEYHYKIGKQTAHVKILDDYIEKDPVKHQQLVDEWFDMLEKAAIRAEIRRCEAGTADTANG